MLASFHLQRAQPLVDACWEEKNSRSQRILGINPHRQMRPDLLGDRTRMDLLWNGSALGIYGPRENETAPHSFVPISEPDTASPEVQQMLREFQELPCPCDLVSVRFRSGESGLRGVWLDTSNLNIKSLLDEKTWLKHLLAKGWVIEVGQKHKEVRDDSDPSRELSLVPAQGRVWLPSFDRDNQIIPLRSLASLFSQPGPEVNRALLAAGFDLLDAAGIENLNWAEWGAGYGNLSAGYATRLSAEGWSSELEPTAAHWLEQNSFMFFPHVKTVRALADEASLSQSGSPTQAASLWLIDPPRPGFPALLRLLTKMATPPRYVLSYHCAEAGLENDASLLRSAGYQSLFWSSVDAFPATLFHEVITLWEKS